MGTTGETLTSERVLSLSLTDAQMYLQDFKAMAELQGWKYFYFAAFDEPWKIEAAEAKDDTVEAHFGLFNADRSLKQEFRTLTDSVDIRTPSPTPSRGQLESASESATPAPVTPTPSSTATSSPTPATTAATGDSNKCMTSS